ncbi:hypothetical protein WJX82_003597 [Trebouxia sp. C0006]
MDPGSPSYGTSDGSCGYGDLSKTAYPFWSVAALSTQNQFYLAGPADGCGECFEIQCLNSGGQFAALTFNKIAPMLNGRIDIQYRRVECTPPVPVKTNGGSGGVKTVQVKGPNSGWEGLSNTFGAEWEIPNQPSLPIDLHVISDSGQEAKGSLMFADWKTAALDSSEVMKHAEEPTSQVTQLRLAAAQLHAEYVITEFHALKKQANIEQQEFDSKINKLTKTREELQKAMEEQGKAMKVLEKELHETRTTGAGAQQAAQLKTTELEASSQVSKDLQEQLSWLTTEKAAMEQRLQAKTAEVVGLHDKATTSEQQSCDLKTKNSRLEQEVGRLKKNLADVTQLNCKMSQAQDDFTEGLQTQLVKLQQEKDASDRALQRQPGRGQHHQGQCTPGSREQVIPAQEQLAQRGADLREAKQQLVKLQKDFHDKCDEADEMKSAQQVQQDAELATSKQVVTRLAAHQELAQKAHHASVKTFEDGSAQLQQQLAQKGTDLSSAEESLAFLQQEMSQAQDFKHQATKDAQARSVQLLLLQKQLDRKVTDLASLQHKLTSLHADPGKMTKAKEVCPPAAAIEQSCTGGAQESEANRGRGSDAPQLSSRRDWDMSLFRGPVSSPQGYQKLRYSQQQHGHRVEYDGEYEYPARHPGDLTPACPRVQQHGTFGYDDSMIPPGFPARQAASGPLVQSDRSNGPSSPATPPDEPKGRCSALTRLSQARGPTSQPFTHQGSSNCGGSGGLNALGEPDMPPGFGPVLAASTRKGKGRGPVRMPNLYEAFGDRLPSLRQMLPELVGLAEQLGKLHESGLVHQAVHQRFVLVGQQGDWKLARLEKAAPMNSNLDDSMVYEGIEAPEMANEQLSAGYYYPNPKHDIWSFGLLLFFVLKGIGHLPHEHQTALQNGNTLLFANKLCDQGKYTTWRHKVNSVARPDSMNVCLSLRLRF